MKRVIVVTSMTLGLISSLLLAQMDYQAKVKRDDASMELELARTHDTIEEVMIRYYTHVEALEAFVHAQEDLYSHTIDQDKAPNKNPNAEFKRRFDVFAKSLESNTPGIGSLQLAPQGIITFISQEEANAKAIGHDMLQDPERRKQLLKTIINDTPLLVGPLNLVQGGNAILARKAIYTHDEAFDSEAVYASGRATFAPWPNQIPSNFWGFASLLIHVDTLYKELGLMDLPKHYQFAIKGRHALGAQGEVFWGDPEVFNQPRFTSTIVLPGGSWLIGIKSSLPTLYLRPGFIVLMGLLVGALIGYVLVARQEKLKARAEARAQSRFLSVMSHEIRTPMNGIIGMSELLQHSELNNKQQNQVDNIVASSKMLLRLVNDILDFSRIDSKSLQLEHNPYSVKTVVNEVVGSFEHIANNNNIEIVTVINDSVPRYMMGDVHRLQQILTNLLSNAVKFTHRGSILVVATLVPGQPDHKLSLLVRDTGIGMSEADVKKLFQPFPHIDQLATPDGGTGLGLVICRNLALLMGGDISVRSEPQQGSEFEVLIPCEATLQPVEEETHQDKPQINGKLLNIDDFKNEHKNLKILVVDDNPMNIVVAEMILEELGYDIDKAGSGLGAIEAVQNKNYDIIYMDRHMPEMDGLEATRRIRELSRSDTYPWIVAFTASTQKSEKDEYLQAGANDFLSKPIETAYMDKTIRTYLGQAKSIINTDCQ